METQWFPFIRYPLVKDEKGNFIKNEDGTFKKGEPEVTRVQGSLRPIELWEYVFPVEGFKQIEGGKFAPTDDMHNLKAAIAMQSLQKCYNNLRPEINKYAWLLRKMMHLKKIPELDISKKETWEITDHLVPTPGMAVYPVGIKDDFTGDFEIYGYNQEGL